MLIVLVLFFTYSPYRQSSAAKFTILIMQILFVRTKRKITCFTWVVLN